MEATDFPTQNLVEPYYSWKLLTLLYLLNERALKYLLKTAEILCGFIFLQYLCSRVRESGTHAPRKVRGYMLNLCTET